MHIPFWHILYTKPQFERTVYRGLKQIGFDAFLPTTTELRQWSDRKKKVEIPLFPAYVFVKLKQQQRYQALSVRGAVKFVSFADEIATVSDEEIQRVELLLANDFEIEVTNARPRLNEGDHVFLDGGPLAGQTVEFIEYKGKKRGLFKLDAIGKYLIVNLPLQQLQDESIKQS